MYIYIVKFNLWDDPNLLQNEKLNTTNEGKTSTKLALILNLNNINTPDFSVANTSLKDKKNCELKLTPDAANGQCLSAER